MLIVIVFRPNKDNCCLCHQASFNRATEWSVRGEMTAQRSAPFTELDRAHRFTPLMLVFGYAPFSAPLTCAAAESCQPACSITNQTSTDLEISAFCCSGPEFASQASSARRSCDTETDLLAGTCAGYSPATISVIAARHLAAVAGAAPLALSSHPLFLTDTHSSRNNCQCLWQASLNWSTSCDCS